MKPGDLVRVVRRSVLVPSGQIGLVTETHPGAVYLPELKAYQPDDQTFLCLVKLIGGRVNGQIARVLARDLEIIK